MSWGIRICGSTIATGHGSNQNMRILRGLSSRVLPCGCLTGVYETYDNEIVGILDARGPSCVDATHHPGQTLPLDTVNALTDLPGRASDRPYPSA
jgi:hypothetical protein